MISLPTVSMLPSKLLMKGISEISFDLLYLVVASLYAILIPSLESNFAYRSSYVAALAILTAFLLALFAYLNLSLFLVHLELLECCSLYCYCFPSFFLPPPSFFLYVCSFTRYFTEHIFCCFHKDLVYLLPI